MDGYNDRQLIPQVFSEVLVTAYHAAWKWDPAQVNSPPSIDSMSCFDQSTSNWSGKPGSIPGGGIFSLLSQIPIPLWSRNLIWFYLKNCSIPIDLNCSIPIDHCNYNRSNLCFSFNHSYQDNLDMNYLEHQLHIVSTNCRIVMVTFPSCRARKQLWHLPRIPSCTAKMSLEAKPVSQGCRNCLSKWSCDLWCKKIWSE